MSENVISQNDIAELRRAADKAKMTPGMFDQGERLHTLLDVYEGQEEVEEGHAKAIEDLEKERDDFKDDLEQAKSDLSTQAKIADDALAVLRKIKRKASAPNTSDSDFALLVVLGEIAALAGAALND